MRPALGVTRPAVSLLICTRDRAASLAHTLASVSRAAAALPLDALEVLVVDNGSIDATQLCLRRWANEQRFAVALLFEERPGLARARNAGLHRARGRIVAITDDDCRLHPDYFSELLAAFARAGGPAIIGGRILPGDPADLPVTLKLEDHPMIAGPRAFPGGFVMGANLAFCADALARIGGFDDRFGAGAPFVAAEDTDFLFRATRAGIPVLYDHRFVVDHHHGRRHPHEARRLLAGYGFGDGALYAKHLWHDARVARAIAADVAALWLDIARPVRTHPGIRFFYAFRLRHKLAGFGHYCRRALARTDRRGYRSAPLRSGRRNEEFPMADTQHDVSTLNSLLATVIDSVDGFEQAIAAAETGRYQAIFQEVATDRRGLADEIEREITRLGGTPEEKGTILASAHRVLIKLREAVQSGDTGVVDEAERGEDYIKGKFEKATGDETLSPEVRSFVETASARVRRGHDKIRDLKHAIHADA